MPTSKAPSGRPLQAARTQRSAPTAGRVSYGEYAPVARDALQAYLNDISNLPLLSKAEEQHWAKQYAEARQRMEAIIDAFPQVFISKLRELEAAADSLNLADFIDVRTNEENDVVDEYSRQQLVVQVIRRILGDEQALVKAIEEGRHRETTASLPSGYNTGFSALLYTALRDFGRVRFMPRFYSECVDFFINGDWKPGRGHGGAAAQQALRQEMAAARERSREAMKALVEGNLRLVIYVVHSFNTTRVQTADLIQEGNMGLIRAVELFEYQRGHRFSTYACYWIRQAVIRALAVNCRTIKIPPHVLHVLSKIRHAEQELLQANGEIPSPEQLAAHLQMSLPRIRALQRMAMQPISLQALGNDERDWSEILSDRHREESLSRNASANLHSYINSVLAELPEREQEILVRRFGLNGNATETLEQIAASFGLSSERIRQLEAAALHKLRRWTRAE